MPVASSNEADLCEKCVHLLDFEKTERYFACVGDISTFKCYFHRSLHAECYARRFWRWKKQTCTKNAIIYSILKKTERYFAFVGDISTFKRYFHRILHGEYYARQFHRR